MKEKDLAKIRGFINEKEMSEAVYELLLRHFLAKKSGADVNILASQMLAVQLLEDGWVEMRRLKNEVKREDKLTNPGI